MKKFNFLSVFKAVFTFIFLFTVATACSNSASSDDHDHEEADGFRLYIGNETEAVVEQLPEQDLTGEIQITKGDIPVQFTIFFIAHDGDEFQPEEDEYSLDYEFSDSGIAEFEQHAEDGKWSFHIHAEAEGITELTLMLMHNDHSDFETKAIHVHVEAAEQ